MGSSARAFTAGHFGLELEGKFAGWVISAEGGMVSAEIISEKLGTDPLVHKHIGGIKYGEITVVCGTGMSKQFYDWIKRSVDRNTTRMDGALITANFDMKEVSRLTFTRSLISEYSLPALDGASKDPARITVKIHPEVSHIDTTNRGKPVGGTFDQRKQKSWLASNFRLDLDGLEEVSKAVSKIEALSVKQGIQVHDMGDQREVEIEPTSLNYPNLVITLPEARGDKLYKWYDDFVRKGNNGEDKEKTGTLEFLSANLKDTLFTIDFYHLGISNLTLEKLDAGSDQLRRMKAEMYCERMTLKYGDSTWA